MHVPELATDQPDQKPPATGKLRGGGIGTTLGVAVLVVVLGIAAGMLGTLVHLHIWWISSVFIPWGALLALILMAALQLWVTFISHKLWAGSVLVLSTFSSAVLLAFIPSFGLSVPVNSNAYEVLPGPVVAEVIWLLGVPLIGMLMMFITFRMLREVQAETGPSQLNSD